MMKILTQKMVGAQGLEAGMSGFCHFEGAVIIQDFAIDLALSRFLSFRAQRETCFLPDGGKQQVPRRFRSSE
jgi:hypothetical protein